MLSVTFSSVTKVIVAVLIGAYSSGSIPFRKTTMLDFSFLIAAVLLPALTIVNTARTVDLKALIECSILIVLSVVYTIIGSAFAFLFQLLCFNSRSGAFIGRSIGSGIPGDLQKDVRLLLRYDTTQTMENENSVERPARPAVGNRKGIPYVAIRLSKRWQQAGVTARDIVPHLTAPTPESDYTGAYGWSSHIAFGILNSVTLPLSLLESLTAGVPWASFEAASAYTFVFSIFPTVYAWTGGPYFVRKSKRETKKRLYIRLLLEEHLTRRHLSDAATQTGPEAADGEDTDLSAATAAAAAAGHCERFPYDWESAGLVRRYRRSAFGPMESVEPSALPSAAPSGPSSVVCAMAEEREGSAGLVAEGNPFSETETETDDDDDDDDVERDRARNNHIMGTEAMESAAQEGETNDSNTDTTNAHPPTSTLSRREGACGKRGVHATPPPREGHRAGPSESPQGSREAEVSTMIVLDAPPLLLPAAGVRRRKYNFARRLLHFVQLLGQQSRQLLKNPPFMSIIIGMVIGLVPVLHDAFFDGGPLEMLMDATALVGQGNIPCALMMLGASLAGTGGLSAGGESEAADVTNPLRAAGCRLQRSGERQMRHAGTSTTEDEAERKSTKGHAEVDPATAAAMALLKEPSTFTVSWRYDAEGRLVHVRDAHTIHLLPGSTVAGGGGGAAAAETVASDTAKSSSAVQSVMAMASLKGISQLYVFGVIAIRLLLIPFISYLMVVAMVESMPFLFGGRGNEDLTMILILFIELAVPTAINSTIMFAQQDFMMYHWAKMLFLQYVLTIPSMVLWTWLGLRYTETLVPGNRRLA
eukprot:gene6989-4953_t